MPVKADHAFPGQTFDSAFDLTRTEAEQLSEPVHSWITPFSFAVEMLHQRPEYTAFAGSEARSEQDRLDRQQCVARVDLRIASHRYRQRPRTTSCLICESCAV